MRCYDLEMLMKKKIYKFCDLRKKKNFFPGIKSIFEKSEVIFTEETKNKTPKKTVKKEKKEAQVNILTLLIHQ